MKSENVVNTKTGMSQAEMKEFVRILRNRNLAYRPWPTGGTLGLFDAAPRSRPPLDQTVRSKQDDRAYAQRRPKDRSGEHVA